MAKIIPLVLGCALLATPVLAGPVLAGEAGDSADAPAMSKGERELAAMLEGYEAGEPVSCLSTNQRDRMQIVDDTALVFKDRGTIYVNRTSDPRFISDFDVPVFRVFGSNICRLDRVEFIDRYNGIGGPVVILEDFIPYTKIAKDG